MKTPAHISEKVTCDECKKEITASYWYRIFLRDDFDFCSESCAVKYRNSFFRIIFHDTYERIIGNTD